MTLLGDHESLLLDTEVSAYLVVTDPRLLAAQQFKFLYFVWWPRLQAVRPVSDTAPN